MLDPTIAAAIITSTTSIIIAVSVPIVISIAYLIRHIKESNCLTANVKFNNSNKRQS